MIKDTYCNSNHAFASNVLKCANYPSYFHVFAHRSLDRYNLSARSNSVSHKVPSNCRDLSVAKSAEIRKLFNNKNVGVVLAADETFLRCHERGGRCGEVLVPKGTKRAPQRVIRMRRNDAL